MLFLKKILDILARLIVDSMVERIKAEYAKDLEELKQAHRLFIQQLDQKHQFKLAALDKRLQAHQEAYTLWWHLVGDATNQEKVNKRVADCQDWWMKNNLYLTEEAEKAFFQSYFAAKLHPLFLSDRGEPREKVEENFQKIRRAGEVLKTAVALPSWREPEEEHLEPIKPKAK